MADAAVMDAPAQESYWSTTPPPAASAADGYWSTTPHKNAAPDDGAGFKPAVAPPNPLFNAKPVAGDDALGRAVEHAAQPLENAPVAAPMTGPKPLSLGPAPVRLPVPPSPTDMANAELARQAPARNDLTLEQPVPKTIGEEAQQATQPQHVQPVAPAPATVSAPATPQDLAAQQPMRVPVIPTKDPGENHLIDQQLAGDLGGLAHWASTKADQYDQWAEKHLPNLIPKTTDEVLTSDEMQKGTALAHDITTGRQFTQMSPEEQKTLYRFMTTPHPDQPIANAIAKTIAEKARAFTRPDQLLMLALLPESKLVSLYFGGQMAKAAYQEVPAAWQAHEDGDDAKAAGLAASGIIDTGMAALSAAHLASREAPVGEAEKPVLHATDDVEALRASAERQAPAVGDAVAAAAAPVPGAKVEAVRDAKDADRIDDKAERQNVRPSQIADIAAAKVTVPHQAAADAVLKNLHEQMPVQTAEGSVTGEPGKNEVRQVQAVVDTGAPATEPVKKAEVLIQTPEMNEATAGTHDDYRKAQEMRAAGDDAGAKELEAKIQREHEAAEAAAQRRLDVNPIQGGRPEPEQTGRTAADDGMGFKPSAAAAPAELPQRATVGGHDGRATEVLTPTQRLASNYRLVEAADLQPSHNAQSFEPNAEYPAGVQERDYKNSAEAQNRVIQQAQNYDPAYTVNTNPDAVNGPPVITPDGTVLGGNSRAMSTQRVYAAGAGDGYRDTLRRDAATYGLTPEQVDGMKQPVLVRQIERPASVDEASRLGTELNKSMTAALGVSERAVSAGKKLKPETLAHVAGLLQEGESLRQVMAKHGPDILRRMAEDGALTERERPQFLDKGELSEEGKTFVERALRGSVIDDSRLMDAAPAAVLDKIDRIVGPVASLGARADEWNLLPALRPALLRAVAEHARIAKEGSTVDLTVNQKDLFGPGRNPLVDALVRVLDEKPSAVRAKFEAFARDANQNKEGETRMFGGGEAFDAFNHAFGSKLTAEEFHHGIAELAEARRATSTRERGPEARTEVHQGVSGAEAGAEAGHAASVRAEERNAAGDRVRAPRPVERTTESGSGGAGARYTGAVEPAIGEVRAPKPPAKSVFKPGRQATPVEVRDAEGNWQKATLDFYNDAVNGSPRRGRVTLDSGFKMNNVADADMRMAKSIPKLEGGVPGGEAKADIGVDFDGTIAKDTGGKELGAAIPERIASIKKMLDEGKTVEIITRRVENDPTGSEAKKIQDWLEANGLPRLPVTDQKTAGVLYDDNAHHAPTDANTPLVEHARNLDVKPGGGDGKDNTGGGDSAVRGDERGGGRADTPRRGDDATHTGAVVDRAPRRAGAGDRETKEVSDSIRRDRSGGGARDVSTAAPTTSAYQREPGVDDEDRGNKERSAEYKRTLKDAAARTLNENAVAHKSKVVDVGGGHKALVLDADGEGVWHRVFARVKSLGGRNPLGAGEGDRWTGISIDRNGTNLAIAFLKAQTQDMLAAGIPEHDGFDRLAELVKQARNERGEAMILRGDYRADTAREEAAHLWQKEHGLNRSEAMKEVASRPEFQQIAEQLRDMGYHDAKPNEIAEEMMAKSMAGDPDFPVTDAQRESLVRSFLTEAVEERGLEILHNVPEVDARVKGIVEEVRKEHGDDEQRRRGNEGRSQQPVREEVRPARGEVRERDGGARDPRVGQPAEPGDREGGDRGVPEKGASGSELKAPRPPDKTEPAKHHTTGSDEPVFQRSKAPRPPGLKPEDSLSLPGMENADAERKRAEEEEQGRDLTETLRAPKDNVSRAAGEMERNSPLFFGSDANEQGTLFQRAKDEENLVAKSVSGLVDDLKKMPAADKGTALDRVSSWTKDAVDDSLERSKKSLGGVPSKFEKAFAWAKATSAALVHDYAHPLEQTDWKTQAGQMQLAQAETALRLQELGHALKDAAPKETDRIAMTHWMEAAGDETKLKQWAAGNKSRAMQEGVTDRGRYLREAQKHYDQALKLTPEQKQLAQRLREHFDDMLAIAKNNGLLEYGYRNYVMHLYEKAEAANLLHLVDNSELNPNPAFLKKRFHDTFYSAEGDGLTPKSKDIGYLLTAYDESMNEAIASRGFMRSLLDAKAPDGRPIAAIKMRGGWLLARGDEAPQVLKQRARPESLEGYRDFDRPQLRNFLFKPTTADLEGFDPKLFDGDPERLAFRGDLIIHPKYAPRVEDMLTPSWFERGEGVAQKIGSAVVKASALAKELMTAVAPFHMVQEGVHGLEHKVNPFNLPKLDLKDETQRLLASHGLTLTNYDAEGLFSAKALKGIAEPVPGLNKAMDAMQSFSRWQFEDYIPRLKMQMATEAYERNVKRYPKLEKEQIAELSAKQANAAFGNLNTTFDAIPRTKTFKTLLRLATFAPDFLESRMRFVGQAFGRYGGEQRVALARGALAMYAVARLTNALMNNGDAKWDAEHAFSVVVNGKSYGLRTVQGDILHAVTDPRGFIYNRLNPLTTRPIVEFLSGRDQMGRQVNVAHQAADVAKGVLPFGAQKVIQTPDEDWLNSLLTSAGLQAGNYRSPTEDAVHKLYLAHIPDAPDDEEKEAESRHLRQIEDKVRSGHMTPAEVWAKVQTGELTAKQAGRTVARAQKSRMQIEFQSLSLKAAMKIYAGASPLEQAELRPELGRKTDAISELPEADREKTAEKLKDLLASNTQ